VSARQALEEAATAAGIWITDPSGTEAMSGIRTAAPSASVEVLSQALVRGGRGVCDGEEIRRLATETEQGFAGVTELSIGPISLAVVAIEQHLNNEQAGRLTRLLRSLWEAGGGDVAKFPHTATLGKLNEDDLSYILRATSERGREPGHREPGRKRAGRHKGAASLPTPCRVQALRSRLGASASHSAIVLSDPCSSSGRCGVGGVRAGSQWLGSHS
jgi:hypothetical protein